MVFGITTTYVISVYHHWCCEFESRSGRSVQHYVIKFCQWLAKGRWFSPGPPVSSTNKTDRHDITEILLKVTLKTIKQRNNSKNWTHMTWKMSRCMTGLQFSVLCTLFLHWTISYIVMVGLWSNLSTIHDFIITQWVRNSFHNF